MIKETNRYNLELAESRESQIDLEIKNLSITQAF